jgi:hypothetical protein
MDGTVQRRNKKKLHNSRYASCNELVLCSLPLVWLQSCLENITFRSLKMIRQTSVVNFLRFTESRADEKKSTTYSLYEMNVIWRVNYMLQTNLQRKCSGR